MPTRLEISNFEAGEKSPVSTDSIRETSASVKQNAKTNPKIFSKDIRFALPRSERQRLDTDSLLQYNNFVKILGVNFL